ncbi:MAG: site-specific integrase [Bacteroidales bacterium]|nr:site-specific integrase [Bacteroidales bacterium]
MAKRIYKAKEPVKLRQQKIKDGNISLYLDYNLNGKRVREYLKLYLIPEHESTDKGRNKETLRLAQAVKAQRITELQNGTTGFRPIGRGKIYLSDWLQQERERFQKQGSTAYQSSIRNTIKQVKTYGDRPLNKIDKAYLEGYIEHLKTALNKYGKPLSANSQSLYYDVVAIALNRAVKEGYIKDNPSRRLDAKQRPKQEQSKRVFLTIEELKTLQHTKARIYGGTTKRYKETQNAFLFSCYTGLRYSDIVTLKWEDIKTLPDGSKEVVKTMQKTKETAFVPLSVFALEYLPTKPKKAPENGLVFNLARVDIVWDILQDWSKRAGLEKHISFHTARHTFATLALSYGADVYTIKELLGHKNINTTQIYAKVVAETKRKAVNLIPSIK